jgi:hypothetical protein
MHRYEVRALHTWSALEGIFYVEALGPAAAAIQAFIVAAGGRPPEIVDAIKVRGDALGECHYQVSLSGEPSVEMIVRLLQD